MWKKSISTRNRITCLNVSIMQWVNKFAQPYLLSVHSTFKLFRENVRASQNKIAKHLNRSDLCTNMAKYKLSMAKKHKKPKEIKARHKQNRRQISPKLSCSLKCHRIGDIWRHSIDAKSIQIQIL